MTNIFENVLQMSLTGSVLALAVMVLRIALRKAPKRLLCLLWALVALRLVCPFSIESSLSLVPKPIADGQIISEITDYSEPEAYFQSIPDDYVQTIPPDPESVFHVYPIQERPTPMATFSKIWAAGAALMLFYAIGSYLFLRRRMAEATLLHSIVWQSERTDSPFVLGLFRPRIILPYRIDPADLPHVIAHERAHIRRGDHWWKPLGYCILAVHWFNPVLWLSYILLCRDIESACDEAVIASMEKPERQAYSTALLNCSIRKNYIAACPIAFGEVGVKERVKNVMNYRKPGFWVMVIALILCVLLAVCFLTDPNPSREFPMNGTNVSDLEPEHITERILDIEDWESSNVYMNSSNFTLTVDSDFDWVDSQTIRYFFSNANATYASQLRIFPEEGKYFLTEPSEWPEQNRIYLLRHYLEALKYLPQEAIRQLAPADQYLIEHREEGTPGSYDRVITYTSNGVQELDGWFIHLRIQPLHKAEQGYDGTGEEVIEVFYGSGEAMPASSAVQWFDYLAEPENMIWDGRLEINLPEFPGVTFQWFPERINAVTEDGITPLYSGMPIWNTYFCDLTGDGLPELCSTLSFGSGMIDNRVMIYDYANGVSYELSDRGFNDYSLRFNESDGQLYVDQRSYYGGGLIFSGRLVLEDNGIRILGLSHTSNIIHIFDPIKDENFAYDTAVELFFEDGNSKYYFSGIYSQYVIVTYEDGTAEDIATALRTGRATIADLDRFGIRYWAEPKEN